MEEDTESFGEDFAGEEFTESTEEGEEGPIRVKLPRGRQVIGIVLQRLGAGRMRVVCMDGKTRICRVPGRLKKSLWVREEDVLIIEPWALGGEDKGDVVYKYKKNQANWLRRNKYLDKIKTTDEF